MPTRGPLRVQAVAVAADGLLEPSISEFPSGDRELALYQRPMGVILTVAVDGEPVVGLSDAEISVRLIAAPGLLTPGQATATDGSPTPSVRALGAPGTYAVTVPPPAGRLWSSHSYAAAIVVAHQGRSGQTVCEMPAIARVEQWRRLRNGVAEVFARAIKTELGPWSQYNR